MWPAITSLFGLLRVLRTATFALTTSAGTTPEIDLRAAAGGSVHVPAGSPITLLTYHGAPALGGTYLPIYDGASAVTQTVAAGRAYPLPEQTYGFGAIKIVANNAGSVDVALKT